jgi:hypothetical protein
MAGAISGAYSDAYDVVGGSGTGVGGWDGLLGILRAAREEFLENERAVPVACPVHGEPLQAVRGVLHCAVGHLVDRDGTIY